MIERFSVVAHTAEIGLRLQAGTYEGLFRQAAKGLLAVSGVEDVDGPAAFVLPVVLEAESPEELLVDWINELVPPLFTDGKLPAELRFKTATDKRVECEVRGPALPAGRALTIEVKAAAYHGLIVARIGDGFEATVILDV